MMRTGKTRKTRKKKSNLENELRKLLLQSQGGALLLGKRMVLLKVGEHRKLLERVMPPRSWKAQASVPCWVMSRSASLTG